MASLTPRPAPHHDNDDSVRRTSNPGVCGAPRSYEIPGDRSAPRQPDPSYVDCRQQRRERSVPNAPDPGPTQQGGDAGLDIHAAYAQDFDMENEAGEVNAMGEGVELAGGTLLHGLRRPYRKRRSTGWKLQHVIKILQQDCQWNLKQFVAAWVNCDSEFEHRVYRNKRDRRAALRLALESPAFEQSCDHGSSQPILYKIQTELRSLVSKPNFGKFDTTVDFEEYDIPSAIRTIQQTAPTWYSFMFAILSNDRADRDSHPVSDKQDKEAIPKKLFMLTAMACHSRFRKRSNVFHTSLSLYLHGSGTKRRVMEVLFNLGLCQSYSSSVRAMETLAEQAKTNLRRLVSNEQTVIVYDNMNFKNTTRHEVIGHRAKMEAVTTAAIVLCPDLPAGGLSQSMHDPSIPLSAKDIFAGPGIVGDDTGLLISQHFIAEAVKSVHIAAVDRIFEGHSDMYPTFPSIDQIELRKTTFWQFGGIFEDEGTIGGTYNVHDNIFLDQLALTSTDDPADPGCEFRDRLWLVHGDQLTAQRIRSVKAEQKSAERPYDRRGWMLGLPAWFHIQMNLLHTIVRTHFEVGGDQSTRHTLKSDGIFWKRSIHAQENIKYHLMEPLVTQGFNARIIALFYAAMARRDVLGDDAATENIYELDTVIAKLSPKDFNDLVEDVRVSAFTLDAWNGAGHADVEFTNMCRLVQEIETFLTVKRAVKNGDLGHLRRLIDPLIIIFFGMGQSNYGREMLFYRWNLSAVNDDELQRAILSSGLVNWTGVAGNYKPIDLSLEHLNNNCKTEINAYKNSTKDVDLIFNRVCLCNTRIRQLRDNLEHALSIPQNQAHTTMKADMDIFALARILYNDDLAAPRAQHDVSGEISTSPDIIRIGASMLGEKVSAFNQQHVQNQHSAHAILIEGEDETVEIEYAGFADIREYVDAAEDIDLSPRTNDA